MKIGRYKSKKLQKILLQRIFFRHHPGLKPRLRDKALSDCLGVMKSVLCRVFWRVTPCWFVICYTSGELAVDCPEGEGSMLRNMGGKSPINTASWARRSGYYSLLFDLELTLVCYQLWCTRLMNQERNKNNNKKKLVIHFSSGSLLTCWLTSPKGTNKISNN
jgi:hypothetical protein